MICVLIPCGFEGQRHLEGARPLPRLFLSGRDTELFLEPLREIIGMSGGVSAWDGKLIARLVGADGFDLRKTLIPALKLLSGKAQLPKVWTL